MQDDLETFREKIRCVVQNYLTAAGMMCLGDEPSWFAAEFGNALNIKDPFQLQRIEHKVAYINCCLTVQDNDGNDWCTEDEALEAMCWHIIKQPQAYIMKWTTLFEYFFDLFDQDKDGYINEEQFAIFYRSFYYASKKREDKEFVARAFKAVDKDNKGRVSKKEYLDAYMTYLADPTNPYEDLPLF